MRKVVAGLLGAAVVTTVGISVPTFAQAAPPVDWPAAASKNDRHSDELPNPFEDKRRELRETAINGILKGEIKATTRNGSKVAKVGTTRGIAARGASASSAAGQDQYVELSREKTDRIFVILAEFGNERHPNFPDADTDPDTPGPTTFEGPLRNKIPQPNRAVDNTTVWQADYNQKHYSDLYFGGGEESLKSYYEKQSSGRYSVDGKVTDWVKVQYNEARYGRTLCDAEGNCDETNAWNLVRDAADKWVVDQKTAGRTDAQIAADMKSFDVQDRYDFDGDGDFNEPDGYIDHFQIVHAGGDQSDGDPQQGEDALWAHRWYAFYTDATRTGPANNRLGGTQIGNTGIWIGDYTVQPENGGVSVFAHEYAHDLGLPDDYDTSGGTNNANPEYWTLMAQSRLSGAGEPLGTRAGDLGAWQKMQLGWLDYEIVAAGQKRTIDLGPQEYNTDKAQGLVVVLPDKDVTTQLGAPFAGTKQYFSGNESNLDNTMTREFDLTGATTAALAAKARYAIESGYDYLYVEASENNGATWTALNGTVNGAPLGKDASNQPAVQGTSGGKWVDLAIPLNAYAGKKVQVRFHYRSDGGVNPGGFFADDIVVSKDGAAVLTDGAETATTWALKGFAVFGASYSKPYDHFYIAGHRSYVSYDKYLATGPYNIGYANTKPDWAEHFKYQQGLLISYNDTSFTNNNISEHPGQGRNLIVDSRPRPLYNNDGNLWRSRVSMYDAPFGTTKADSFTLHVNGKPSYIRGQAAAPLFDDTKQYFYPEAIWGVKLPATGVKIKVVKQEGTSLKVQIS